MPTAADPRRPPVLDAACRLVRHGAAPCGGAPHAGRRLRVLALAFLALFLVAMLCAALYIVRRDTQSAFGVGLALALLPVPLYVSLVVWADRFEPEPAAALGATFLWGAGAALALAYVVNTAGGTIVGQELGAEAAEVYVGSISAPVVEESLKALPLVALALFARDRIDDVVDGVVYAAMVALGFAMSENVLYYGRAALAGGLPEAMDLFVLRGVWNPFAHPLFTAATGAGIAYALTGRGRLRPAAPFAGAAVAMVLHSIWNTRLGTPLSDVLYVGLFLPLLVAVTVVVVRARRREAAIVREFLPRALGRRAATMVPALVDARRRRALRAAAHARGGRNGRHAAVDYEHASVELAFLERRLALATVAHDAAHEARRRALRTRVVHRYGELRELGVLP